MIIKWIDHKRINILFNQVNNAKLIAIWDYKFKRISVNKLYFHLSLNYKKYHFIGKVSSLLAQQSILLGMLWSKASHFAELDTSSSTPLELLSLFSPLLSLSGKKLKLLLASCSKYATTVWHNLGQWWMWQCWQTFQGRRRRKILNPRA